MQYIIDPSPIIFYSWIALKEALKKSPKYILIILLLILFANLPYLSISPIKQNISKNYSSNKDVTEYIKNNLPNDSELVGTLNFKVSAILLYLNHKKA